MKTTISKVEVNMSPVISRIVAEYCAAKGLTRHADMLEKDVRFALENHGSTCLNKTVRGLANEYRKVVSIGLKNTGPR